ncbi:MAG: hypothetical protein AABY22_26460 [Nanoarchaeota archaeon]
MGRPRKPSFEDKYLEIKAALDKRAYLWNLKAKPDWSWEDFGQICLLHIYKKWHLYNYMKPLAPWVNKIIYTQFSNFLRNQLRFVSPCTRCPLYHGGACLFTSSKVPSRECSFFSKWQDSHQSGFNITLPVSTENHQLEINSVPHEQIDYVSSKKQLEVELKKRLSPFHWKIYDWCFIKELPEEQVVKKMGFKKEVGRSDCKQIRDAVFVIKNISKKILDEGIVDL